MYCEVGSVHLFSVYASKDAPEWDSRGERWVVARPGHVTLINIADVETGIVYIGGAAALSFLQFLRATLRQYAGPSAFTESVTSYMMLEASVGGAAPGEGNEDLCHDGKAALIKCFIQAVSTFAVGFLLLHVLL